MGVKMNELRDRLVYCRINRINGKRYIGQTNDLKRRSSGSGIGYKPSPSKHTRKDRAVFWNAICKYGWDNFETIVLKDNLNKNEADYWEQYYINEFRTFVGFHDCKGYNMTLGGDGTIGLRGKLNHNYGKHLPESQKQRLSEANSKQVNVYNDYGVFIETCRSGKYACDKYGLDTKTLWKVMNGKSLQAKGYVFTYTGDDFSKYRHTKKDMKGENHPMYGKKHSYESKSLMSKNSLGKNLGKKHWNHCKIVYNGGTFNSIREASEYFNEKYTTMQSWLNGRNSMPDKYKRIGLQKIDVPPVKGQINYANCHKRKVICINNGQIFDSISDASTFGKTSTSNIIAVCKGYINKDGYKRNYAGIHPETGEKLRWEYA